MTTNNLCNSCSNYGCEFQSGIVRTKCAFYMPPHIEPDNCGNYVVMQPTVNVLDKIRAEIDSIELSGHVDGYTIFVFVRTAEQVKNMALDVIDKYKAESEGKE